MFDTNKIRESYDVKVRDIIKELFKENLDATFCCCGDNRIFIHVEEDNSVVSIDNESIDEGYENPLIDQDIPCIEESDEFTVEESEQMISTIIENTNISSEDDKRKFTEFLSNKIDNYMK